MNRIDRIFLIGPMGAGKSTIGRRLAQQLGLEFIDLDTAIEERTGVDIPRIFDIEGEAGFRRREATLLDELSQLSGIVLATGGGAAMDPDSQRHLGARGVVVYLRATIATQLARTRNSPRPMIQSDDPEQRLRDLHHQRALVYETLADITIDTEDGNPERIARILAERIQQPGSEP